MGIYLWGSLTYGAFDERYSDVDLVAVTRGYVAEPEFAALARWFDASLEGNPWTERLDMRFVIDGEFLDKKSRCCGFYSGKLTRHGSDGNPIIWLNVGKCGVTLWGRDGRLTAPAVSDRCLNDALLLELTYLEEDLAKNAGDRSVRTFRHNAYAVLTACRILYTAQYRAIVAREQAYEWAMSSVPPEWRGVIGTAWENSARDHGTTTPRMEADAADFAHFVRGQTVGRLLARQALRG